MPKFFIETDGNYTDTLVITGEDAAHICRVLRMKPGERVTVCDCRGSDYDCAIAEANPDAVTVQVLEKRRSASEPSVRVTLFQGLPKGDKMDLIVQKSVELGVSRIVPVLTQRSVSRPDGRTLERKVERWGRIAASAAKQSGRGILPEVGPAESFEAAVEELARCDAALMLYEANGGFLRDSFAFPGEGAGIGVFVGPEGGFDEAEVAAARERGVITAGLGPRILRTETAPLCALSVIMFATGNL